MITGAMSTIMKVVLVFICTILHQNLINGETMVQVSVQSIDVTINNNPYLDWFVVEISGAERDIVTVNASIIKTPPEGLIFKNSINFNDVDIPPMEKELCEMFDDKLFAPEVLDHGVPKNKFPKECPISPSDDYAIYKYKFPSEKLPPGLPDGTIKSEILVFHRDNEDEIIMRLMIISELKNKVPLNPFGG